MSFTGNELPICLLTGASGRLGTAILSGFRRNLNFAGVFRRFPPTVESNLASCVYPAAKSADSGRIFLIQADLSSEQEIERVIDIAEARYGRVDHVINAAADLSFYGATPEIHRYAKEALGQIWINSFVPALVAAAVARRFWKGGWEDGQRRDRSILNVSSISGINIYRGMGQASYSASKAALHFLTCHMADEYSSFGARVNCIAPTAFPKTIPVENVVMAIGDILSGNMTGKILRLDESGLAPIN